MASEGLLHIWLNADPLVEPPDVAIEDIPGVSDIQLVARAIAEGRLGRLLPTKIAISTHERPNFNGYRNLDVARLLQEYQIASRRRFEIFPTDPS